MGEQCPPRKVLAPERFSPPWGEEVAARNFAGVPSRSGADPARARVVLIQTPYEGTVCYGKGAARGPEAILASSRQVETHDEETGIDLEDLSFALGPRLEPEGEDPRGYTERVREAVRRALAEGRVPFVLGGEHSVTIGAVRAARDLHPGVHVLSVDAHADLRNRYGGTDHSHACVMRRVLEGGPATILGVRSYSSEEARFAARIGGLRMIPARELARGTFDVEEFVSTLGEPLYVTVDVDGLDPSVIPGTGAPEPGGLGWEVLLAVLRRVFARRRVLGMDLVELAPIAGTHVSEFAAARLAAKMLVYLASSDRGEET